MEQYNGSRKKQKIDPKTKLNGFCQNIIGYFKSGKDFPLEELRILSKNIETEERDKFVKFMTENSLSFKNYDSIFIPTLTYFLYENDEFYQQSSHILWALFSFLWPIDNFIDSDSDFQLKKNLKDEVMSIITNEFTGNIDKLSHFALRGYTFRKICKEFLDEGDKDKLEDNLKILSRMIDLWLANALEKTKREKIIKLEEYYKIRPLDGALNICLMLSSIVLEGKKEFVDVTQYQHISSLQSVAEQNDLWQKPDEGKFNLVSLYMDEYKINLEEARERVLLLCYQRSLKLKEKQPSYQMQPENTLNKFTLRWNGVAFFWQFFAPQYQHKEGIEFQKWYITTFHET